MSGLSTPEKVRRLYETFGDCVEVGRRPSKFMPVIFGSENEGGSLIIRNTGPNEFLVAAAVRAKGQHNVDRSGPLPIVIYRDDQVADVQKGVHASMFARVVVDADDGERSELIEHVAAKVDAAYEFNFIKFT